MDSNDKIIEKITTQGMLPLFYHDDKAVCLAVTEALYEAGVRVIEFTNRGTNALDNFTAIVKTRNEKMKDLVLAVGTIATGEQAGKFITAGADFLISPYFDGDVCDMAYLHKILWIPGCMTPTEIHVAENAGCKLIKIFPGNVLGPAFVSGAREVFPGMKMMPTGGVELNETNIREWFKSGVCAVGMGSKLISKTLLENKDYAQIKKLAAEALTIVRQSR